MRYFSTMACIVLMLISSIASSTQASTQAPAPSQQAAPPQPIASYTMDVKLDPATKTVSGHERISYRNPSQDNLTELYLRLYLKAFSSLDTLWMRESGGQLRGDKVDVNALGDIVVHSLRLADGTDILASTSLSDTLLHVPLAHPLAPNATIELDAEWTSTLPRVFARTGYGGRDNTFFMVGQWYPKMTVYDRGAWDTEPWHATSEFFNDVGNYAVTITVPKNYIVAGAGVQQSEKINGDGSKTLNFISEGVTDYAFAASPDFQVARTISGPTDISVYYLPEHAEAKQLYRDTASNSVKCFGEWYGAYPWPHLTVVDVPDNANGAGGMEYPTLVTGGSQGTPVQSGLIQVVTSHEIGHEWWPMQTATNEGREPWLDEGITEYSGLRYMIDYQQRIGAGPLSINMRSYERSSYAAEGDQPLDQPAWEFSGPTGIGLVYNKSAVGFWTLEDVVGTEKFRAALRAFIANHRFSHPSSADFRAALEAELGPQSWFFDDFVTHAGTIDYAAESIDTTAQQSSAVIRRIGTVRVPVDVKITSRSGVQRTEHWDGQSETTSYVQPASDPITRVEIDPDHKLHAELNVRDNGLNASPDAGSIATASGRFAFWTQLVATLLGLFG